MESFLGLKPDLTGRTSVRRWFARAWIFLIVLILLGIGAALLGGQACNYLATDFRGYYASGLIIREAGIAAVYQPERQAQTQAGLLLKCPDGTARPPRLQVLVPYLPVFVLPFRWLPVLDFSASYLLWTLVNLAGFLVYLARFSLATASPPLLTPSPARRSRQIDWVRLLQWLLCFPLAANLALGQINFVLVIALGEFTLALQREKPVHAGLWLASLLIKPHVLILLLPGLLISRRWRVLLVFGISTTILLAISVLLAGPGGMQSWLEVVNSFAETSFYSLPDMMNARALAFNLERFLPAWISWLAAACLTLTVLALVWRSWLKFRRLDEILWLMLGTLAGTCLVAWHANLYLWIILLPFLFALDRRQNLPASFRIIWIFGPAIGFILGYLLNPALAQPFLATGILAANITLVVYIHRRPVTGLPRQELENARIIPLQK